MLWRLWVQLLVTLTGTMVFLGGCSTVLPRNPLPVELESVAQVPGIPEARFWGDDIPRHTEQRLQNLTEAELQQRYAALYRRPHNYLAISGGGADGAFGAGLLTGWSATGDRPEFQMVTGISTGALTAPFAFLGPRYDAVLREVYTKTSTTDILRFRAWISILFSDSAADSAALHDLIRHHVDDEVIAAIAAEHARGRRLFIGTTDLDHSRPRIWDIGAIAANGHPSAKDLVHKIMLASASIPGAFPPVRIGVVAEGKVYDELHVDGGTTAQVFIYPATVDWGNVLAHFRVPEPANIFVIRNASLKPRPETVEPKVTKIADRAISSLIRSQGIGDLYLIYMLSIRDGANYHLADIPDSFDEQPQEFFDPVYMNKLFDLGYQLAKEGYPWEKTPPGWIPRATRPRK